MAVLDESTFQSRIGKGTKVSGKLNFKLPTKIEGEAEGEISGDDIVIALRCTISTPSLVLNEGAVFDGDCKMPREKAAA